MYCNIFRISRAPCSQYSRVNQLQALHHSPQHLHAFLFLVHYAPLLWSPQSPAGDTKLSKLHNVLSKSGEHSMPLINKAPCLHLFYLSSTEVAVARSQPTFLVSRGYFLEKHEAAGRLFLSSELLTSKKPWPKQSTCFNPSGSEYSQSPIIALQAMKNPSIHEPQLCKQDLVNLVRHKYLTYK